MLILSFDFQQLANRDAFYQQLAQQSHCPYLFGNNLDALWDWLTGEWNCPQRSICVTLREIPVTIPLHRCWRYWKKRRSRWMASCA